MRTAADGLGWEGTIWCREAARIVPLISYQPRRLISSLRLLLRLLNGLWGQELTGGSGEARFGAAKRPESCQENPANSSDFGMHGLELTEADARVRLRAGKWIESCHENLPTNSDREAPWLEAKRRA